MRTQQFADATVYADPNSAPAFFFNVAATDLNVLVQALETTMDAKTLASPKIFALNGQQARIQVGGTVGYTVTTTTQTMSSTGVEFLSYGTILLVTPQITPDNKVMMKVKPQVSTAEVNPITKVPDSKTQELETSVVLPDGYGIVIGGLIQEEASDSQTKVPILGDLWLIGRLFQQREVKRTRSELIISLIPHIVPFGPACQQRECEQFYRSTTPLLQGPLEKYPRPFEPSLPDAGQCPSIFHHPSCPEPSQPSGTMMMENQPLRQEDAPSSYAEPVPAPPGTAPPSGAAAAQRTIQQSEVVPMR
jgi:type II secretory pathway component GspD/PulD (secretin)